MRAAADVAAELDRAGYVHLRGPLDHAAYVRLSLELGGILGQETIELRDGAHAYVARPGRVPLHTDHPEVRLIGWLCEEQDETDGSSLLLDSRPIIESLPSWTRERLHQVELECPPLAGGPPILRWPVLRTEDGSEKLFCSPWLKSISQIPEDEEALGVLRKALSAATQDALIGIRLAPGDALYVDNRRVLHGRREIGEKSPRRLCRHWIR